MPRTITNRNEVSMKLPLAMVAYVADPLHVLAVQRDATMTTLQDSTRFKSDTNDDDLAWLLHLDRLILRNEADLRWLDRVEERLARNGSGAPRPGGAEGAPTVAAPSAWMR